MPEARLDPSAENLRRRVAVLRQGLVRLHKALVDSERVTYERVHGRVASSGELLQAVIHDPWFAWLRPLSELVIRMDELLEAEEPATVDELRGALDQARSLLTPSEEGPAAPVPTFGTQYWDVLQRDPAVVLVHAQVSRLLTTGDLA
ncbi:MAG TPA: hypothetical protein VIC59_02380 [Gemmatimonadota bacterium]|jgi:hypothetical protein